METPFEDGVPLAMPDNVPIILSPLLFGWINDPRLYATYKGAALEYRIQCE